MDAGGKGKASNGSTDASFDANTASAADFIGFMKAKGLPL